MSGLAIAGKDVELYVARVYYHEMSDFSVKCDIAVYANSTLDFQDVEVLYPGA